MDKEIKNLFEKLYKEREQKQKKDFDKYVQRQIERNKDAKLYNKTQR